MSGFQVVRMEELVPHTGCAIFRCWGWLRARDRRSWPHGCAGVGCDKGSIQGSIPGDPETAWRQVLEYVCREATNHTAEVATLVEDLIYLHADRFIDRIEAEAASNQQFRVALSLNLQASVSDAARWRWH